MVPNTNTNTTINTETNTNIKIDTNIKIKINININISINMNIDINGLGSPVFGRFVRWKPQNPGSPAKQGSIFVS